MLVPLGPKTRQLGFLDAAVEAQKKSIELDRENVEAHALIGSLYPLYYRLAPRRGTVVGSPAQEPLDLALGLEAENSLSASDSGFETGLHARAMGREPGRRIGPDAPACQRNAGFQTG